MTTITHIAWTYFLLESRLRYRQFAARYKARDTMRAWLRQEREMERWERN